MKTVLLLEDDPQLRKLLVAALTARSLRVLEAGRAKDADKILEKERPALVVVDGLLPDVDGLTWIEKVRPTLQAKVVFLSAFWKTLKDFDHLTKDLGVALVMHKPIKPELFAEQIVALLERLDAPAPPPPPAGEGDGLLAALETMKQEYALQLPAKLDEVTAAVRELRQRPAETAAQEAARMLSHRLAGTSGTYGFTAVGEASAKLEELIIAFPATKLAARVEAWKNIDAAVVTLGLAVREASKPAPGTPAPTGPESTTARLLVVDGDPAFLDSAAELGKQQIFELIRVPDAAGALAAARNGPLDGALIDARLAGDPGQLANDLRSLPAKDNLPLAFICKDPTVADRVAAAHAGASLFLAKPIDHGALGDALQQLVAEARASRPRVLLVDDDETFLGAARIYLESDGVSVFTLRDPMRILEVLDETRPDLVTLDVLMPGISGFDVCRLIRQTPRWQDLPVLIVTGQLGLQARISTFEANADDYIPKPVVREELLARVHVRIDRARLLREKSYRDALTGVMLRRAFTEALHARLAEAKRLKRTVGLALLDVDRFKSINDQHGHLAGDQVLTRIGRLLSTRYRVEDLRGRWGGEEFILAIPGAPAETSRLLVERLLKELQEVDFRSDSGDAFRVSFSAGVATYPTDGETTERLIEAADRRLRAAKTAGRSRVHHEG